MNDLDQNDIKKLAKRVKKLEAKLSRSEDSRELLQELKDKDQKLLKIMRSEINEDIERRKLNEATLKATKEELQEKEESFRALFEKSNDAIVIIDLREGKLIDVNPFSIKLFQFDSKEELMATNLLDLSPEYQPNGEKTNKLIGEKIGIAIENNGIKFDWVHIKKDGTYIDCVVTLAPLTFFGTPALQGVIRDVSEDKIRQRELANNKANLESIFNSSLDAIMVVNIETGKYVDCNSATFEMFGIKDKDELYRINPENLSPKHQEDGRLSSEVVTENTMVVQEKGFAKYEWMSRKVDGTIFPTHLSISSSVYENEDSINVVVRDITEARKAENEIKEARKIAEAATKAKSDFLANMSHEIRTPMNAIIGLSRLLENTELNNKQNDYVVKTSRAATNLLGIINDILDFSKIEAGKMSIEQIDFDLDEVLDNLSSVIGIKAFEKGLEFVVSKKYSLPNLLVGDPLRLGQILLNLVNNSIKFTAEGQVFVKIEEKEVYDDKVTLEFSVHDSGIGMTPDQLKKLFKAFGQADSSTSRKFGGTGLGLTISKSLVEGMGGTIGVTSEYGTGSIFSFTITFKLGANADSQKLIIPKNLNSIKSLIIDDNSTSRDVLSSFLDGFGFASEQASDGYEAIELIDDTFNLVFMDYKMPGLNGVETWGKIVEKLSVKPPKVIMLTAYGKEEVIEEANNAGIQTILMKPVAQSTLFNSIMTEFGEEVSIVKKAKGKDTVEGIELVRGAKILVAEDNEINQQVAKETLEYEGFYVDIAENGKIAVEMFEANEYDIIFMDLQMPVMSGYDAAKLIRTKGYVDIPIIALSADAMAGILEKVEEVGMNGFVAKPIDLKELLTSLVQWISPDASRIVNTIDNPIELADLDFSVLERIDYKDGLKRVANNSKVYIDILRKYIRNYSDFADKIISDVKDQKDDVARSLHTLKGVAGNIGAKETQKVAKIIETAYKSNTDILKMKEMVKLKESLNSDNIDITKFLNTVETEDEKGKELSDDVLLLKLYELVSKLDDYDAECESIFEVISSSLTAKAIKHKEIQEDIENYEFENAVEKVKKVIKKVEGDR